MSSWQMFVFGGGKCPNLGVVNVRILGVVNVLLANDSQSTQRPIDQEHTHKKAILNEKNYNRPPLQCKMPKQFSIFSTSPIICGCARYGERLHTQRPIDQVASTHRQANTQLHSLSCKVGRHLAFRLLSLSLVNM